MRLLYFGYVVRDFSKVSALVSSEFNLEVFLIEYT